MESHLIDTEVSKTDAGGQSRSRAQEELEIQNTRLAAALRRAELAIEASTMRILSLKPTRGAAVPDFEMA